MTSVTTSAKSTTTFARHSIRRVAHQGAFETDYHVPFSPRSYSRFKYGSKSAAREMGFDLAAGFLNSIQFAHLLPLLREQSGVIYPSPYKFVPTATAAMKDYFLHRFNCVAVNEYGIKPLIEGKVYRDHSYNEDYGAMSEADRRRAISSDNFRIETSFLSGQVLLFLDDIRITGSHEIRMAEMVDHFGIRCPVAYLYYAAVADPLLDPRLENYLNYAGVKSLLDINHIVQNDKFIFNTRVVKFILSASAHEFQHFILYQSDVFQSSLLSYATGNGYFDQDAFAVNYQYLYRLVNPVNQLI